MTILVDGRDEYRPHPRGLVEKILQRVAQSDTTYHASITRNTEAGILHVALASPGTKGSVCLHPTPEGLTVRYRVWFQGKEWKFNQPETPHEESEIVNTTVELVKVLLS